MPRKDARQGGGPRDVAAELFDAGYKLVAQHPLFAPLASCAWIHRREGRDNLCPANGWAVVTTNGYVHVHPTRRAEPEEWAYALAHCLLHLGFGHFRRHAQPREWNAACCTFIARFLAELKLGRAPMGLHGPVELPAASEERAYEAFCERGIPAELAGLGTAGPHAGDLVFAEPSGWQRDVKWGEIFGQGLAAAVTSAVQVAAGVKPALGAVEYANSPAQRARSWFISSYPLLGALAASFRVIEDPLLCHRMGVSVAAVHAGTKEVYMNPAAGLDEMQCRFVMAHELLHVGLRHEARRQGRDPFLWNVACFPAGTWTGAGCAIEEIATMQRRYVGAVVHVDSQGGAVVCTPEHPFFVRRRKGTSYPIQLADPQWMMAGDLREGDYLLVPLIRDKVEDAVIDLRVHIKSGSDSRGRRTFGNRAIKEIPLDEDTAWLIGLYVAEGSSSPHVRFALGAHETALAQRLVGILTRLGYSAVTRPVAANRLDVTAGAVVLGRWLKRHCGGDARTKCVPRIILRHANPRIRAAFLRGLVAGDGHSRKQTASQTTYEMIGSVSERLIADVALLLAQDGIGGARGVMRRGPRRIGDTWTERPLVLHTFQWNPSGIAYSERTLNGKTVRSSSVRWKHDEYGVWYRLRSTTTQPFDGTVYNLTTPEHTYIANGFLVHNCDYVINGWLVEMGVGHLPSMGLLHDPELKGLSAEAIYDRVVTDLRRFRRLATFRGAGVGDVLDSDGPAWWSAGDGVTLDEFYRRSLSQGLSYHYEQGRGLLPGGLEEEIRALGQPPVPWDVELAKWFDHYFPPPDKVQTYARPSRRQSSTPDIPRPRWIPAPDWEEGRTFGVLLDTSGSMGRELLAKALGTIASYSIARDVPAARVVFCDAATYDQGYMAPEAIAQSVKVRGRGGTILQPGVDLLERAEDFPPDGPLLIITDGACDKLHVRREHAYLVPEGHHVPFVAAGPVFYIK